MFFSFQAHADDALTNFMGKVDAEYYKTHKPCPAEAKPAVTKRQPPPLEIGTGTVGPKGGELSVSIISKERLGELRGLYPTHLRVRDHRVCAARAHVMGSALAQAGITTAKIYLSDGHPPKSSGEIRPTLYPGDSHTEQLHWPYHVVNVLLVKDGDQAPKQYVLDPFLNSRPLPLEEWERHMHSNPESKIASEKYLSRFNIGIYDANKVLTDYDPKLLTFANGLMDGDAGPHDETIEP